MSNQQITVLVLGSTALGATLAAMIAALAAFLTKRMDVRAAEMRRLSDVREARLALAVEMARINLESTRMLAENSAQSRLLLVKDPAELVWAYWEGLAVIAQGGASYDAVLAAMNDRIATAHSKEKVRS